MFAKRSVVRELCVTQPYVRYCSRNMRKLGHKKVFGIISKKQGRYKFEDHLDFYDVICTTCHIPIDHIGSGK